MADKDKDNFGTKVLNAVATMAAAFMAPQLLMIARNKGTRQEPPTDPEDPRVARAEALGWSALVGITMATVRVLAVRAVSRKNPVSADSEPANAADG